MEQRDATRPEQYAPHVEVFRSSRTEELIQVRCHCRLGRLHTYQEWAGLPENRSPGLQAAEYARAS